MSIFRIIPFFLLLFVIGCDEAPETSSKSKTFRVGILSGLDVFEAVVTGFKDRMKEIGYEEGANIEYVVERANGDTSKMEDITKKFADDRVDLVLTTTNKGALLAKLATENTDIPVVFTIVMAPVETGIVDSLTNPSGNLTGVRNPLAEFIGKRLEILRELHPKVKTVLILHDPDYPIAKYSLKGIRQAAERMKISLKEVAVKTPESVVSYLENASGSDIDAMLIMPDLTVQDLASLENTFTFAKKMKIPVVANTPRQVEMGALFSYHTDSYDTGRAAAQLANKALAGKHLQSHPVINAEPRLVLNLGVAKILDLKVNDSLRSLSHRTIE